MLRELGLSYQETLDLVRGYQGNVLHEAAFVDGSEPSHPLLVKLGLMLIARPAPSVISEAAGAIMVSVGLIYSKIRKPPLYIEDVYNTFPDVIKKLRVIKRELV